MRVARTITAGPCIEMDHSSTWSSSSFAEAQSSRRRRDCQPERASVSSMTDEGSQRDHCALAALPKKRR
eukprot:4182504-Prymnesium_polylepis.1